MERVAVITGASQGLGRALAKSLAADGWNLVLDARRADRLAESAREVQRVAVASAEVVAIPGDITDPAHRAQVVAEAQRLGAVRLVVNNASTLGRSPLPSIDDLDDAALRRTFEVNVVAPVALVRELSSDLGNGATVVAITSDAAVEAYHGWGAYGATKAALEQINRILAVEHPEWRVLIVDPGDMRTEMHQDAFPGEDISDRPLADERVPGLRALIDGRHPSGRYQLKEVV
jgi:NAD(P)-dependent dehydrogenase (short-subunit alcohol dehydrogenase family)